MAHGGGATYGARAAHGRVCAPAGAPLDPSSFPGFSYFLGPPGAGQQSILGKNPTNAREILQALYNRLPIAAPNAEQPRNESIPSGYTYLLQLVAHDLVDTTVPFWVAAESGIGSRNVRSERLQLDTLYGGGPTSCPIAFKPAGAQPDFRTELRLGRVAEAVAPTQNSCLLRDLPRLELPRKPIGDTAVSAPSNFDEIWGNTQPSCLRDRYLDNAAQVYVADIRNDDTLILTQLVVLFSILHNAIAHKLTGMVAQAQFALARAAVLSMYHAVIRHDLLKRILNRDVYDVLMLRDATCPAWLWRGHGIPLEFSHGAFRFGHAMVRPSYDLNAEASGAQFDLNRLIGGPIIGSIARDPLPSSWVLKWSKFFEFPELPGKPAPNYSLALSARQHMPLDQTDLLPEVAPNTPDRVSIRDWLSAAAARMWRPDALIDAIKPSYSRVKFVSPVGIRQWFHGLFGPQNLADFPPAIRQDPGILTNDLPLPLYVLLEAQLEAQGKRLGPLGSVIVGEVIFRCLAEAEATQAPLLSSVKDALGSNAWCCIAGVRTMPCLVRLAANWGNLSNCRQIPFIA